MILADKIITLRKKNGWSQEELAEKLNVTRQSVSKWEGAQSTPDLDRILKMSQIFGVSTDYLLKEEQEEEEYVETVQDEKVRRVSMEEANEFLAVKKWSASKIAIAVFLYILSPACMLLLGAAAEEKMISISEDVAGGIGMVILLLLVAVATSICLYCGSKTKPFEYMEYETIDTEYGVTGMVKERQKQFKDTYYKGNIIGVCFCILALIPVFIVAITNENQAAVVLAVPLLLLMVGIGVFFFVRVGIIWATIQKILQEEDYSVEAKKNSKKNEAVVTIYWTVVLAIFLGYSFITSDWGSGWIIWAVAGVLFAAFMAIYNMVTNK